MLRCPNNHAVREQHRIITKVLRSHSTDEADAEFRTAPNVQSTFGREIEMYVCVTCGVLFVDPRRARVLFSL
jgi:hypothetical protein